ncbi:MAG: hypothetical protein AAGF31_00105 [Planctomycetota bacterium]
MRSRSKTLVAAMLLAGLLAPLSAGAAVVSLEIANKRGTQATAPKEWLQLLAEVGVTGVRIRSARTGEQPSLETINSGRSEIHQVVGVLTSRDRLLLPGGTFTRRDRARLRDYFATLSADGAAGVTEAKGTFGLTKKQFEAVFDALSTPLRTTTKGKRLATIIDDARTQLSMAISIDRPARAALQDAEPIADELATLSVGTALTVALQSDNLALVPIKPLGKPVQLSVVPLRDDLERWPAGYPAKGAPRSIAPDLMQAINVEIDGFTLAEAMAAITPRVELPVLWDRAALRRHDIDPATIDVRLPKSRLSYKRIFEKLLFQARLRGQLRVDESGTPFYWISR